MSASEGQEATSTEDSKPISSRLVHRTDKDGKPIEAYNLSLNVRCAKCRRGEGFEPHLEEHDKENCVSKHITGEKSGYVNIADLRTRKENKPKDIYRLHGLEEFILKFPDGETPRIDLSGDFCQLIETTKKAEDEGKAEDEAEKEYEAKEEWKETVHTISDYLNTDLGVSDVDFGDFVKNLGYPYGREEEPDVTISRLFTKPGFVVTIRFG